MTDSIVYIDRSMVRDGELEELKSAMGELVDFVEANEPEILTYDVYFNANKDRMTVMHTHADQDSLGSTWRLRARSFPRSASLSTSNPSTCMAT